MSVVEHMVLEIERLATSEPLYGVYSATYRRSLDYVPSTQVFGWIVKALTQHYIYTRALSAQVFSTLQLLDIVDEVVKEIEYVWSGFPIELKLAQNFVQELAMTLRLTGYIELSDALERIALSELAPYALSLAPLPPFIDLGIEGVQRVPLAVIPTLPLLRTALKRRPQLASSLKRLSDSVNTVRRFGVGIAIDRVRRGSAYARFYAYQYTYGPIHIALAAKVSSRGERALRTSLEALRAQGLGYKKSIALTKIVNIDLVPRRIGVDDAILEISKTVLRYLDGASRSVRVAMYAFGETLHSILINAIPGRVVERMWLDTRRSGVYLSITNSYYMLVKHVDGGARASEPLYLVGPGSYVVKRVSIDELGGDWVKNLVNEMKRVVNDTISELRGSTQNSRNRGVKVEVVKTRRHEYFAVYVGEPKPITSRIEKRLVLTKVASSIRNISLIPLPEAG